MFCYKCGKEIQPGGRFCPYCGAPMEIVNTENTEPVVETVNRMPEEAAEAVTPIIEETLPPVEGAAPVIEEAAPVVEEAAPVVEEAAPVIEEAAPVIEEAAPVIEEAAPVIEEAAPVVEEAAPVVEEAAPVVEEAAPVVEEAAPVIEEAAPVIEEAAPVIEEAAPVIGEAPAAQEALKPAPAPAAPKEPNPMFKNFMTSLKLIFTGKFEEAMTKSAADTGMGWIISVSAFVLAVMFGVSVFVKQTPISFFCNFGLMLLFNFLWAILVAGTSFGGILLFEKVIFKKDVKLFQVLNVIGTATLPLSATLIAGMLLGLMTPAISAIFILAAVVLNILLTYYGVKAFGETKLDTTLVFMIIALAVIIVGVVFGALFGKAILTHFAAYYSGFFNLFNLGRFR